MGNDSEDRDNEGYEPPVLQRYAGVRSHSTTGGSL